MAIYGYCRISQKKQNIERQVRNILNAYPTSIIIREAYTGRKIIGRKEWEKIYRTVKPGDLIVFDSVSRFSRNAEEGFELYQDLYYKSVDLVFLKEPQINTETFKRALDRAIPMTGTNVDYILDGINKFLNIPPQNERRNRASCAPPPRCLSGLTAGLVHRLQMR